MSQPQLDVVAIERELPALRQAYEERGKHLRDLLGDDERIESCRRALQDFHDAGLAWLNHRCRLIVVASVSGADQDSTWYTYQAETALHLMETIPEHYAAVFAAAERLGLPSETFKPGPTSFSELQRLVVATNIEAAEKSRAAFAKLGLPTVGFDLKETEKAQRSMADVLLVTVNDIETHELLDAFEIATGGKAVSVPLGDRVYRDLGEINGTRIFHALSEMGSSGLGAAQQTVDKALQAIRPKAIIAVGVAFGVDKKKQAIGDILVSKQLWLYESLRVGSDIKSRGDKPHASPRLINFFEGMSQTTWRETPVKCGLLVTGEKLIDNLDFRSELLALETEAIGGEMEGAGVYVAGHDHKAEWIIIKAICDWADGNKKQKKKERQQIAARNASRFLVHALQQASLKAIL